MIDVTAPNIVVDPSGHPEGIVTMWNPHGIGECIVQFFDGSASSMFFTELTFLNGMDQARKYLNDREP